MWRQLTSASDQAPRAALPVAQRHVGLQLVPAPVATVGGQAQRQGKVVALRVGQQLAQRTACGVTVARVSQAQPVLRRTAGR